MDDLEKYIAKRKTQSVNFSELFDKGYESFKIGILLKKSTRRCRDNSRRIGC